VGCSQATSVFDTQFDHTVEDRRHLTSATDRGLAEPNWILDDSIPAPIRVLQLATGRWVAHLVGVAAELGLADLVQSGPKTAEQLADAAGLHAPSLYRLLRALASIGVLPNKKMDVLQRLRCLTRFVATFLIQCAGLPAWSIDPGR
jgi:hypothetical protein